MISQDDIDAFIEEQDDVTLRVKISIVPFGDETKERVIREINISNLGRHVSIPGVYTYGVEVDKYKTEEYDVKLNHHRENGAETLVVEAIDMLLEEGVI